MSEEELLLDIAEARGMAMADSCLMTAVVATLVAKGTLTNDEAATLPGIAATALAKMDDVPVDVRVLAEAALKGFSTSLTRLVTRN